MADATLPSTRLTLLTQLRQDPSDQAGWDEFVERYGRHIYRWCRQWKLQDADAEDVTQDILVKLTHKLRAFAYDPSRSFRGWLKTVAHHAWRDFVDSRRGRAAAGDSQVRELMQTLEAREDLVQKLEEAFDQISEELRSQYQIGYYYPAGKPKDGGFRKIKVEVGNKDQKVLARKGFYAPKS